MRVSHSWHLCKAMFLAQGIRISDCCRQIPWLERQRHARWEASHQRTAALSSVSETQAKWFESHPLQYGRASKTFQRPHAIYIKWCSWHSLCIKNVVSCLSWASAHSTMKYSCVQWITSCMSIIHWIWEPHINPESPFKMPKQRNLARYEHILLILNYILTMSQMGKTRNMSGLHRRFNLMN